MRNVKEMQEELSKLFNDVRSGAVECKTAAELSNICGKMISASKAQLEYYGMRKERPKIAFLSTAGNSDESV